MSNQTIQPVASLSAIETVLQALQAALPVLESAYLDDVDRKCPAAANVCFAAKEQVLEAIAQMEDASQTDTSRLDWVIRQISGSGIGFISGLHHPSRDLKETRAMIDAIIESEKAGKADCLESL